MKKNVTMLIIIAVFVLLVIVLITGIYSLSGSFDALRAYGCSEITSGAIVIACVLVAAVIFFAVYKLLKRIVCKKGGPGSELF